MDKQVMVNLYNEILISNKKELTTDKVNIMIESQKHYFEQKKPDGNDYVLYNQLT